MFEPIRVIADATATFTNLCVRVHSYVRVLLQKNCGVITSQLSMLAPCVCVCVGPVLRAAGRLWG